MAGTVNPQLPLPTPSGASDVHSLGRALVGWANSLVTQLYSFGQRINLCLPKDGSEKMTGTFQANGITNSSTLTQTGAATFAGAATFDSTVTLSANPTTNLEAATKQYVDAATTPAVYPKVRAHQVGAQNIAANTWTKLLLDTTDYDTNSIFASSRITPDVAGYYDVTAQTTLYASGQSGTVAISVYKNGSQINQSTSDPQVYGANVTDIVYCNGTTDYLEIYVYNSLACSVDLGGGFLNFVCAARRP